MYVYQVDPQACHQRKYSAAPNALRVRLMCLLSLAGEHSWYQGRWPEWNSQVDHYKTIPCSLLSFILRSPADRKAVSLVCGYSKVSHVPILHLLLDFSGQPAPALGTIWDFILSDALVLQNLREAADKGTDVAISAVTGPSGVLSVHPCFNIRQCNPAEFAAKDTYMLAPSIPAGAAEVRVHLTGREASALAILIHRYWPEHMQSGPKNKKIG